MEPTEAIVVKNNNGNGDQAQPETEQVSEVEARRRENQRRDPHSLRDQRAEAEIHAINQALEETKWNRKRAARLLSISYRGLLYKIRQHNITATTRAEFGPVTESGKIE